MAPAIRLGRHPDLITAIATVGLLAGAIVTAIYAARAFSKQAKEVAILTGENKRQADERRRAQAVRVFTGAPQPPRRVEQADPILMTVPYARNASDLPIYDAQLWCSGLSDSHDLGMILPGKKISGGDRVLYRSREQAVSSVILTFRDAAGLRWIRMPDGALSEQTRAIARESVQVALEPDLPDGYDRQEDQIVGPVLDAIVVRPRSRGVLRMPGQYSLHPDFRVKVNRPPEYKITLTSGDGSSTQGVYTAFRRVGPLEGYSITYDVWNHRDSSVTPASLRLAGRTSDRQITEAAIAPLSKACAVRQEAARG